MTAVEVSGLTVRRGKRIVLDGLDCRVPTGSITGLLGPSGSGKTTLMRAIVGVQVVVAGTVTVLGKPAGHASLRHRLGYMTQASSVYNDLTARENTRYFASVHGLGATAADEALKAVGLTSAADQLVANLSGGQRSRASLACALVGSPELLVLDEPTVGQDPVLRDDLWEHFHRLTESGTTLLISSHVMDEANRCDRLLLIRDGKLIAHDTPEAVKASAGTDDLDQAFLTLIRAQEQGVPA
jgi:ABC-2 type transport system ATP-binding protein